MHALHAPLVIASRASCGGGGLQHGVDDVHDGRAGRDVRIDDRARRPAARRRDHEAGAVALHLHTAPELSRFSICACQSNMVSWNLRSGRPHRELLPKQRVQLHALREVLCAQDAPGHDVQRHHLQYSHT